MHPVAHIVVAEEAVVGRVHDRGLAPVGQEHRVVDGSEHHQQLEDDCGGRDREDVRLFAVNFAASALEVDLLVLSLARFFLFHHVAGHVARKCVVVARCGLSTDNEQGQESEEETDDELASCVARAGNVWVALLVGRARHGGPLEVELVGPDD